MTTAKTRKPRMLLAALLATVGAWLAHIGFRESGLEPGHSLRLAATLMLVASVLWMVVAQARVIRGLDELEQRIHLEALAIGFSTGLCLLFAVGFLRGEGLLQGMDPRDLPMLMVLPYGAGLIIARRHYQ